MSPQTHDHIGVGMVGYSFMGRAHSHAWHTVARAFPDVPLKPELTAICGRDKTATEEAAGRLGWKSSETDWHALIERDDVGLIDISAPGDTHAPIAIAALKAGKHVLCEKPLANTLVEAESMAEVAAEAYQKSGARAMVGFNYRRVPALALARQYVDDGRIGTLRHVRAVYLQDWLSDPESPMTWRMQAERAGSGALGDLGAHIVDIVRYLTGEEIVSVSALSATFVDERPFADGGTGIVSVDDAVLFNAEMSGGGLASFEATRYATGHKNGLKVELNGSEGSIIFDLERLNELTVLSRTPTPGITSGGSGGVVPPGERYDSGFTTILVTEPEHPYLSAWWPAGHVLGWEHTFIHQARDLLTAIAEGTQPEPSFEDGLAVQRVLDAVQKSAKSDDES
ncbi:MAG TPA: Gfo/Idh/MocA family oxidoreductase [Trebonia sp.]|jgi:predicted dehydrogenase